MKIGDKIPVTIAGQTVAQAAVKEVGDGTVTLVVPATLVVMATRTELAHDAPSEPETETVITGVDRAEGEQSAPVGETPNIDNSATEDTVTEDTVSTSDNNGDAHADAPAAESAPAEPTSETASE